MIRSRLAAPVALAALGLLVAPERADACGGCFISPSVSTVVTGHRMAISLSPTQTVLWDQIEYAGDPGDFAWVLPVKPGARIELADQAFFDALEAVTAPVVQGPQLSCGGGGPGCGFGCAMAAADGGGNGGPPPVTVVSQQVIGPYETVTLATDTPGALNTWLSDHGYAVDPDTQPTIDAYVEEGFDFIALRLAPGQGVQAMKPVRVVSSGANPTFPLRMVAAGTGPITDVVLYVISEGRWTAAGFQEVDVDTSKLSWDFDDSSSNFAELRAAALAQNAGQSLFVPFARHGALLEPYFGNYQLTRPDSSVLYASSLPQLYAGTLELDGVFCSATSIESLAHSPDPVVDDCDAEGNCVPVAAGQLPASAFACGAGTDLARAMVGLHPSDVWITRLEGSLPRASLAADLSLQAAPLQAERSGIFSTSGYTGTPPCAMSVLDATGLGAWRDLAGAAAALSMAAGLVLRRRQIRRAPPAGV